MLDPDRFIDSQTPGSQEWWYFDAISNDGRDVLVIVWYAALPFDPVYGVAALKWLRDPNRYPPPHPRDYCAVGLSWYRDGKTMAYALNSFRRGDFHHVAEPFEVRVAGSALQYDGERYSLRIDTPASQGRRRIEANLEFRPARRTVPFERDLGGENSPHVWSMTAADNQVTGGVTLHGQRGLELRFEGRGYHDHNAGSEEISRSIRRWRWGRVHHADRTTIYYQAEPRHGPSHALLIECRDGEPVEVRNEPAFRYKSLTRNRFGVDYDQLMELSPDQHRHCRLLVDDGPFYLRWVSEFETSEGTSVGISEHLDTRHLNSP